MKLEDIFTEWEVDSKIDSTALDTESLKIPSLHHKYLAIYSKENLILRKLRHDYKQAELAKHEYYSGKMDEAELKIRGWEPFDQRLLKQDVPRYLEGDQDLVNALLKIDYQKEKVETLKSILSNINGRSFNINNAVKWQQFLNGVN